MGSVSDLGTGVFQINFSSAVPNANYLVLTNTSRDGTGGGITCNILEDSASTSSVTLQCRTASGGSARDPEYVYVLISPAD